MPPGADTAQAHEQRVANTVIAAILMPITIGVLVYFVFALTTFRQRGDVVVDGPPIHGDSRLQATWVLGTVAVVLVLGASATFAGSAVMASSWPSAVSLTLFGCATALGWSAAGFARGGLPGPTPEVAAGVEAAGPPKKR